jgi:hypothetical protein
MHESDQCKTLEALFKVPPCEYGDGYRDHLLEQYKLYVQMTENNSERRQSANNFFLTVNTALLAFLGIVVTPVIGNGNLGDITSRPLPWAVAVSATGVVLCVSWYMTVSSFKHLDKSKYQIIHCLESKLPSAPYAAEWRIVGDEGKRSERYHPFTKLDFNIPWMFGALYVGFAAWNVIGAVY